MAISDRNIFVALVGIVGGTLLSTDNAMYRKRVTADPIKGALLGAGATLAADYGLASVRSK